MIGNITAGLYGIPVAPSTNSYESIATVNGSSLSATITFSSIPSTYKHLQIRAIFKDSINSGASNTTVQFNNDTASNYYTHWLTGNGSSASASGFNDTSIFCGQNQAGTSMFGGLVMDILDYTSTTKNKTIRTLTGADVNGGGNVWLFSGLWFKTPEAITSIKFTTNGLTYQTGTQFALYGIKDS